MHTLKSVNRLADIQRIFASKWLIPWFILVFIHACSEEQNPVNTAGGYQYEIPQQTGGGWETASLASVGMDEAALVNLMNRLNEISEHRIHSLLIIKDGKLVFEEYFPGDKFNLAQYTDEVMPVQSMIVNYIVPAISK